ncbi:unnamed protein product [Malus baccata var. baccata]
MPPDGDLCTGFACENGGANGGHHISPDPNCEHCREFDPSPSSLYYSSSLGYVSAPLSDSEKLRRVVTTSPSHFLHPSSAETTEALSISQVTTSPSFEFSETLRYGLFHGTFAGTFISVDEIICSLAGHLRQLPCSSMIQHTSLAIYILMRTAVLALQFGIKSKRFGGICKPLTWAHGDIFLMCLSSLQILSAYILKQESLPPSYKSFLNKHGGKDTIVHRDQSCSGHIFSFLIQAYKRALPVYLPVYLISALIVHRQDLLKRHYSVLLKGLLGTARSRLFLSVYCSSAWAWTCSLFRIFRRCNIPMVAMGTFPTGLALAIEKKSRRIEISLYCSAQEREVFRSKYLNVPDWVFGVPPPSCETPRCKNS